MAISYNKYKKTIGLLKTFVDFLQKTSAKKGNISLIKEQIELLDYAINNEIDLLKIIRDEKNKKDIKEKFVKFSDDDFRKISNSLKEKNENELIVTFFRQFPNLKIVKSSKFENDFKLIEFDKWKTDELKFILLHFFSSFPKGKKTKKELFDLIIEYLYQRNYVESIEKTYSEQNKK